MVVSGPSSAQRWSNLIAAAISVAALVGGVSSAWSGLVPPALLRPGWQPDAGQAWWWQAPGDPPAAPSGVNGPALVVVLDPFETATAAVHELHRGRQYAACRLNAGIWEPWRPDAARFPPGLLGPALAGPTAPLGGSPRWLDVREHEALAAILADRLALCQAKDLDGVVIDYVESYRQATGFSVGMADQARFNASLVALAHRHDLPVTLRLRHPAPAAITAGADLVLVDPAAASAG